MAVAWTIARQDKALLVDVFQWDVRNWARALHVWEPVLTAMPSGRALALGEREGGLSLYLAMHGHRVICSDLASPEASARPLHERYQMQQRIAYEAQDITNIQYPDDTFDIVVFKSVIGALSTKERQLKAMSEIRRVLKPGGVLLFAENLAGTRLHRWIRKRFVAWDHYWRYLTMPGDQDLLNGFTVLGSRSFGLMANLGRSERQRALLASGDALVAPLIPTSWKYILAVAARKPGKP
jgi:SAM-dependent methyltransferase